MTELPPSNDPSPTTPRKLDSQTIKDWLAAPLTVTFPGWVFAAAGLAALLLLLIALD